MSTVADAAIAFRCKNCWQEIYAAFEDAGRNTACPHCEVPNAVPQPTQDNICSREKLEQQNAKPEPEPELGALSDEEIQRIATQQAHLPLNEMDFTGYENASILSRFIAAVIDSVYSGVVVAVGVLAVYASAQMGIFGETGTLEEFLENVPFEAYPIFFFPVLIGQILQWNLIATRGQSIGKLVCCIRIVTMNGKMPGFFQGVILRNWVRSLLSNIPFFALIDAACIFTEPQRCIHDYIAGTRVVPA